MNWEMVGAVAEAAGAAGVIATLIYLAKQMRSSAAATRMAAGRATTDALVPLWQALVSDSETASVWRRGLADPDELDEDERVRFYVIIIFTVRAIERLWREREAGRAEDWVDPWLESWGFTMRAPGFRAWFRDRRTWMAEDFAAYIEHQMEAKGAIEDFRRDP